MGKKVRLSSSYSKKRELGGKRDTSSPIEVEVEEDRISQLPDEVLVSILSLLTIRETARTSVLSHRWESLWTSFTGSLNFEYSGRLQSIRSKTLKKERSKYVSWVNQVLLSLGLSSIHLDEFRVRFDLNVDYTCHIDKWIEFALEKKRVQRLVFDLKPVVGGFTDASERYNFPMECFARIKQPRGLHNIAALTSLCLKFVNVCCELMQHFLSNCPLLERLHVEGSEQLLNLKVTGTTLKLKYLEIRSCLCLEVVEISAPNLLSLIYYGKSTVLHVENVPQLGEVSIGGRNHHPLTPLCRCLSSHFSQLETLTMDIDSEENKEFMQFIELTSLKQLILRISAFYEHSILEWTALIKASPFLHRFRLELISGGQIFGRKMQKEVTKCPHHCLKVVELVGFIGCATDVELAMWLFANAITLETVIIDRSFPLLLGTPLKMNEKEEKEHLAAKRRALRLKRNLPSGVNFVII